MEQNIDLKHFFPDNFLITYRELTPGTLTIDLKSTTSKLICPYCGSEVKIYHKRIQRKNIKDLPFLDRAVILNLDLKEFTCLTCGNFEENPENFLLPNKSITRRCQDYLSQSKHSLKKSISLTCTFAANAHIPVSRGVVRYIPMNTCGEDKD